MAKTEKYPVVKTNKDTSEIVGLVINALTTQPCRHKDKMVSQTRRVD